MLKYLTLVIIIQLRFSATFLFAQSFVIKVTDKNSKSIDFVYLRIYTPDEKAKLLDYKTIRQGYLTYVPAFSKARLVVTASGYSDLAQIINLSTVNDTLHFVLEKFDDRQLDTVIVATKRPITIQNDTTTYNVDAFRDGTERKLQDILKKLPGIDVNEKSGQIRFKGKPIETVLLEGDNLFGANYTLGTKNISADIIKEVQAIENYSDNYVLKGLEKDERVALNVKLVKSKFNLSGLSELGIGMLRPNKLLLDANANLIGLQQSHKFFTTVSYNNNGQNKSPIDYFGNNQSLEQIKDRRYWAEKFIADPNFSLFLSESRVNFNSQFFGNYNGIYKIGHKTSLKANLYYLKDDIKNVQSFENQFYLGSNTVFYKDFIISNKRPTTYKADLYLRNNTSPKILIEYTASLTKEGTNSQKSAESNFTPTYQNSLFTDNIFLKNTAIYSQRVLEKNAIQFVLYNSYSSINQMFVIQPSIYRKGKFENDLQQSDMQKLHTYIQANFYGTNKNGVYNFSLKKIIETNNQVANISNDSILGFRSIYNLNNNTYDKNSWVQSGNINFSIGSWRFGSSYVLTYLKQQLFNEVTQIKDSKTTLTFEPNLRVLFMLSKISNLSVGFSLTQTPKVEKYIFTNNIAENYRSIVSNLPSLDLIKTQNINLNYIRRDLFNQFDNSLSISYQKNNGDYLPIYLVTDSVTYAKYLFNYIRTKGVDAYAMTSKYFPTLRSTFKLSANYSIN